MKKIGLTGGIGTGKTYVSNIFDRLNIPVFNSDTCAKECLSNDKALIGFEFKEIAHMPGSIISQCILLFIYKILEFIW